MYSSFSNLGKIGKIIKNSPAEFNDIRVGDIVAQVNDYNINTFSDISKAINNKNYISIDGRK